MRLENNSEKTIQLQDLRPGSCFVFCGKVWMKIGWKGGADYMPVAKATVHHAVELDDGQLQAINCATWVQPINVVGRVVKSAK